MRVIIALLIQRRTDFGGDPVHVGILKRCMQRHAQQFPV